MNIHTNMDDPVYIQTGYGMALESVDIEAQFANVDTVAALITRGNGKRRLRRCKNCLEMKKRAQIPRIQKHYL